MATVTQGGKDAFLTYPRTLGASREAKVRQAGRKEGRKTTGYSGFWYAKEHGKFKQGLGGDSE